MNEKIEHQSDLSRAAAAISGPFLSNSGLDSFTLAWALERIGALEPAPRPVVTEAIEALDYLEQLRNQDLIEYEEYSHMHDLITSIEQVAPSTEVINLVRLTEGLAEMLYDDQTGTVGRFNTSVYRDRWLRRVGVVVGKVAGGGNV